MAEHAARRPGTPARPARPGRPTPPPAARAASACGRGDPPAAPADAAAAAAARTPGRRPRSGQVPTTTAVAGVAQPPDRGRRGCAAASPGRDQVGRVVGADQHHRHVRAARAAPAPPGWRGRRSGSRRRRRWTARPGGRRRLGQQRGPAAPPTVSSTPVHADAERRWRRRAGPAAAAACRPRRPMARIARPHVGLGVATAPGRPSPRAASTAAPPTVPAIRAIPHPWPTRAPAADSRRCHLSTPAGWRAAPPSGRVRREGRLLRQRGARPRCAQLRPAARPAPRSLPAHLRAH